MELTICFQISWPGYRIWCLKGKEVHEDFPSLQHSGQIIIIWGRSLGCCNTWGLTIQIKFLLFENKQFIQTQSVCSRLRSFAFFCISVFPLFPSISPPSQRTEEGTEITESTGSHWDLCCTGQWACHGWGNSSYGAWRIWQMFPGLHLCSLNLQKQPADSFLAKQTCFPVRGYYQCSNGAEQSHYGIKTLEMTINP